MAQRRGWGIVAAALLVVGACGGGDDEESSPSSTTSTVTSTSSVPATSTSSTSSSTTVARRATATSTTTAAEFDLDVEPAAIWMATEAEGVCSPAEPAIAVLRVDSNRPVDGPVRARVTPGEGSPRVVDLDPDDAGGWQVVLGPFDASSSLTDTTFTIDVVVGSESIGELELEVLAPERCGTGVVDRRTDPPSVELQAEASPVSFVSTGLADCAGRPTEVVLEATTEGPIVSVGVSIELPGGSVLRRVMTGGPERWSTTIGPIDGSAGQPPSSTLRVDVVAVDARGRTIDEQVMLTLARPEPCATSTTVPGVPTTVPGAPTVEARTEPGSPEVYATGEGACPPGPTTFVVAARTSGDVVGMDAVVRVGSGSTATIDLTEAGAGEWRAIVGPIPGSTGMPARSDIDVGITATDRAGATATDRVRAVLLRPPSCGGATTTTTTTTAPPATTTTAPATTTTTTSTTSTTTTIPLGLQARTVPDPAEIDAEIDGSCPTRPPIFGVEALTTGPATGVAVRVELATGAQLDIDLDDLGGGRWVAEIGPIPGSPSMPVSSPITMTVRATGAGGTTVDAPLTATLFRPQPPSAC